nr:hypothetical protein [Tanacetum cinerariifolium]
MILEEPASSTRTMSSLQNLDKELSFTNQFFIEKPHEEEPEKTNSESEVQSTVTVPIQQDTSSVPPMTTLVNKAVDEIVTDVFDWAIQASLRARFRDFPKADIKEILLQRIWETGSYKIHKDYKNLYEVLEKSMDHEHSDQLQANLAEAHQQMNDDPVPFNEEHTSDDDDLGTVLKANALATTYQAPAKNSLLEKIRDMQTFMNWYALRQREPNHHLFVDLQEMISDGQMILKMDEVEAVVNTQKLLKHQKLLEKVKEEVEIQKEFLVNLISFNAFYKLRPDLLKINPNGHGPLTSPVLCRASVKSLKQARIRAWRAQSTASVNISLTALFTFWGISRFSKLYRQDPCGVGGKVVVVVVIIVVVAVDVGSGT